MNLTPHWAAGLIGAAYKKKAAGPKEFDCLGLMEYVFLKYRQVVLPVSGIRLGETGNTYQIKEAAQASGLRPVFDMPQDWDMMLMENVEGPHVGLVLFANSKLNLLHCIENIGVILSPLSDLSFLGYKNFRSWRLESER